MADKKPKMELQFNQTATLELLADPYTGNSNFGEYVLLNVKKPSGEELTLFSPNELIEQFKSLKKGDKFEITKLAEQQGKRVISKYDFRIISNGNSTSDKKSLTNSNNPNDDFFYQIMQLCFSDALKISEKMNGLIDVTKIAICLYISRTRTNVNGLGS